MKTLSIDLETYSSVDLSEAGVYRYTEAPDFEVLLIGYSLDGGPVEVVDFTIGRLSSGEIFDIMTFIEWLQDPEIIKTAWNANFERTCLAAALGMEMPPEQWSDTMILAMEMGLPGSLAAAGMALGLPEEQLKDPVGKSLIQYFSKPCKPTKANGGRTRNLPQHDPDKWKLYIEYNRQDVVTEMAIRSKLKPLADSEQKLWELDQRMNDHGVRVDLPMVEKIARFDEQNRAKLQEEAVRITGLQNPNSLQQLKGWLSDQGAPVEQLRKDDLDRLLSEDLPDNVRQVLTIRKALGKTSVKKYGAMLAATCEDSRLRGILQFYGANRSGRWAGRIVQTHNLAKNFLPDLDLARSLAAAGDFDTMETLFGETSFVFSELIRTAFIPSDGCRFVVSDFSAIEARVVAWLAGEDWVLDAFRNGEDIYCKTASMMYHVPVVKHGENGHLRQKGKVAVLACGYQGGVGAMKAMDRGGTIPEDELQSVVDQWRAANPNIVKLWRIYEKAARTAIVEKRTVKVAKGVMFSYESGNLFIRLPGGRRLCYWGARIKDFEVPIRESGGRSKYLVYTQENYYTEEEHSAGTWILTGETTAVSEAQAINNVRYNLYGETSMLSLGYNGGRFEMDLHWKAVKATKRLESRLVYMGVNQETKQWGLAETYGGKLVENVVQATARDCLAEAMTRVAAMGYQIVMHVHDEMIVDVPLEDKDALQRINAAMGAPIEWAPGLPLRGDGYECAFYKKD